MTWRARRSCTCTEPDDFQRYGLLYAPVLAAIRTYVMSKEGTLVYGAALLFVYSLGRGVAIGLAGAFAGALKQLQALGRWSAVIERVSGVIIIGVGLHFLWIA